MNTADLRDFQIRNPTLVAEVQPQYAISSAHIELEFETAKAILKAGGICQLFEPNLESFVRHSPFTEMFFKVIVALLLFISFAPGLSAQELTQPDVLDAFGLVRGTIVSIEGDFQSAKRLVTDIAIDRENYELEIHPYSVRSKDFVLKVQEADGVVKVVEPTPPQTIRGAIRGSKGSLVVGSVIDSGVGAKIMMGDGTEFFIEPIRSKFPDWADSRQHVLYSFQDAKPAPGDDAGI